MRLVLVLVLLIVAITAPTAPPIVVSTRFVYGFAPASFPLRVRIEPHPENRMACLSYESDDYSRRSCWQVEQDSAPSTFFHLRDLPAGEYTAVADLSRPPRTVRSAPVRFDVIARQ